MTTRFINNRQETNVTIQHINQRELATRWGMSERTLERWRCIGWGPCFIKLGGRIIYRVEDIEAYEMNNMRVSTSELVHMEHVGGAL